MSKELDTKQETLQLNRAQQERTARETIDSFPETFTSSRGSTLSLAPSSLPEDSPESAPRRSGREVRAPRRFSDTAYGEEIEEALAVDYSPIEQKITPQSY